MLNGIAHVGHCWTRSERALVSQLSLLAGAAALLQTGRQVMQPGSTHELLSTKSMRGRALQTMHVLAG